MWGVEELTAYAPSTIVNVAPTTDLEERVSRLEEILATTRRPQ